MIMTCGIECCEQEIYAEGVCFFHYPLWEAWGYNGGYEIYQFEGREKGSSCFKKWLNELNHQKIIDILARHDFKLAQAVIETYPERARVPNKRRQ